MGASHDYRFHPEIYWECLLAVGKLFLRCTFLWQNKMWVNGRWYRHLVLQQRLFDSAFVINLSIVDSEWKFTRIWGLIISAHLFDTRTSSAASSKLVYEAGQIIMLRSLLVNNTYLLALTKYKNLSRKARTLPISANEKWYTTPKNMFFHFLSIF